MLYESSVSLATIELFSSPPEFPLSSLSLMDYCPITDAGVACIVGMHTLTELSLSRTKLTDDGMPFLEG